MGELTLIGLHDDGEHLVLATSDGQQFRLKIDEPLRAAVRRDRPQLELLRAEQAGSLSPREIQSRIRAGATAQEVADSAGLALAAVRRYEGPVIAEREYVAEMARETSVLHEPGAPTLGDLVTDRLAARGVDLGTLSWDAAREGAAPWAVMARFLVGDEPREARWVFDPAARTLTAADDEARWLSETQLDEPVARRHLTAVRDVVFDIERSDKVTPTPTERTATILDTLSARRGRRQPVDIEDEGDDFSGFGPPHAFDFRFDSPPPGAHPADADPETEARVYSRPTAAAPKVAAVPSTGAARIAVEKTSAEKNASERPPTDKAPTVALADPEPPTTATGEHSRSRRGRAKVPSWDEIVFGAKPE